VRGDGLGGRNQEMVLAFGLALEPLVAEGAIIKPKKQLLSLRFAMQ
jgi:glycerate-2-kinase